MTASTKPFFTYNYIYILITPSISCSIGVLYMLLFDAIITFFDKLELSENTMPEKINTANVYKFFFYIG